MELLFEDQRGNNGGWDSYYSTPYSNVFIHQFISVDKKQYLSAEKINGEGTLRLVRREILPILGGIGSTFPISRDTIDEALVDAKKISRATKETKIIGKGYYSNKTLLEKIRSHL